MEETIIKYKGELAEYKRKEGQEQAVRPMVPGPPPVSFAYGGQNGPPVEHVGYPMMQNGYPQPPYPAYVNNGGAPDFQVSQNPVNGKPTKAPHKSGACFNCNEHGHWWRNCHKDTAHAKGATVGRFGNETYLPISVNGRKATYLLDTGCEKSMLPRRLVPKTSLQPVEISVCAANGIKIPILGSVRLQFQVEGMPLEADFLVSDAVEKMMLGIDWLTKYGCHWKFDDRVIVIGGRPIVLRSRPTKAFVRRIYVSEVVVPSASAADVPVRMAWNSFRVPTSEWVMEPKQLRSGVYTACVLLPQSETCAAVRVLNVSDLPFRVKEDTFLGSANPAVALDSTLSDGERDRSTGATQQAGCSSEVGQELDRPLCSTESANVRQGRTQKISASSCSSEAECLEPVTASLPSDLLPTELEFAIKLIHANSDVFSKSEFDLGRTNLVPHRIDTGDNRPFKQQLRRHPMAHLDYIDAQVEKMLEADIVEPCASPWSSNVTLAKKSDGSLRFCIDYRRLNDVTYKDSYPLPRIDTCLDVLGGSKYFSTLDLRSGFWQVTMDPRDSDKTAIVTRKGQFMFKVLSFGLANSPSVFQRLMDLVLAGLTWETCLVYIDDVIVFSTSFVQHVERLSTVFQRLCSAGLKLKPSKCRLFQRKVSFLGHVLSRNGIEPDPEKVDTIVSWPVPRSLSEVRSFVGLASYYRSFIKDFSRIAAPLHELSKKVERFLWNKQRQQAFELLKSPLTSAPVLVAPNSEGVYVLDVDASDASVGAIVHQQQEGQLKVIAFASRMFDQAERKYCTTRNELCAVIFGLKRFRQYVLGRKLIVRSDHAALSHLRKTRDPVAQQARWLDYVEQFDIEVIYRSGPMHRNANALSRRPCEERGRCEQCNRGRTADCHEETGASSDDETHQVAAVKTRRQLKRESDLAESSETATQHGDSSAPRPQVDSEVLPVNISTPTVGQPPENNVPDDWTSERLKRAQEADPEIQPVVQWLVPRPPQPVCPHQLWIR